MLARILMFLTGLILTVSFISYSLKLLSTESYFAYFGILFIGITLWLFWKLCLYIYGHWIDAVSKAFEKGMKEPK